MVYKYKLTEYYVSYNTKFRLINISKKNPISNILSIMVHEFISVGSSSTTDI